jgi:photosystem II stability/assembly factor-like uncharacterized protein
LLCDVLPTGNYTGVQFTSENTAYTITNAGKIFKTEDVGDTWIEQNSGTELPLSDIIFLDDLNGYISGFNGVTNESILLKTIDGGETWISKNFQVQIRSIFFADNMNGFAFGQKLYRTIDGGETWDEIDLGYLSYNSVGFYSDKKTGLLITGIPASGYDVLKTSDGGNSWTIIDYEWGNVSIGGIQIVDDIAYIGSQGSKKFKTRDMGNTWQVVNSNNWGHFINELQAVGVGQEWPELGFYSNGVIAITNDRGKHWEEKHFSADRFLSLLDIDFLNDSSAFAVGASPMGCILKIEFK